MDALGIIMTELTTQTNGVIDRLKANGESAKADVQNYLNEIKGNVGVAMDTAIQFPNEQTYQNSLVALANAVWNRTLQNVETFTVAQKYELRAGLFAAIRVTFNAATGVALTVLA